MLTHGGDLDGYARRYPGREPLDFSANLNPLGMPQAVRTALHEAVEGCARYPDPRCRDLREALAGRWQLAPAQIFCANGAAEAFDRLAAVLKPRTALLVAPAFSEYERALTAAGCACRFHTLRREEGFALTGRILPEIGAGIDAVFLGSPNNPTAQAVDPRLLEAVAERCAAAGAWLIVDECFGGFLADDRERSLLRRLLQYDRLVVVRAFTKRYALAGVRLGWCAAQDPALIEALRAAGQPWNVSYLAQRAGLAALGCEGFEAETLRLVARERAFLSDGLRRLGLWVCPGQANFVLFQSKSPDLSKQLLPRGILLRDCSDFRGLGPGWYRAAVRSRAENERLLQALGEV